jgi:hypothetical protein
MAATAPSKIKNAPRVALAKGTHGQKHAVRTTIKIKIIK